MKAVIVKEREGPAVVVDNFEVPEPAEGQVLIKSVYTAINPVDAFMAYSGILVLRWPLGIGCDASGVVVKVGLNAKGPLGPLEVGDEILGCTRLGDFPYATAQEYFLGDAALLIPKPSNITVPEAATVGVGLYTACLGVFGGLNIPVPDDPKNLPTGNDEWVLVLGGSSSVGKFAVQLLKALGYKVLATASPKSGELLKSLGASETLDYNLPQDELVSSLTSITSSKLNRIFDAVATNDDLVKAVYQQVRGEKYFSSTNDWDVRDRKDFNDAIINPVELGPIGRPDATELNATLTRLIPLMYHLLESGLAKPAEYKVIGDKGFESVTEAWKYQQSGAGGSKKVLVHLQNA